MGFGLLAGPGAALRGIVWLPAAFNPLAGHSAALQEGSTYRCFVVGRVDKPWRLVLIIDDLVACTPEMPVQCVPGTETLATAAALSVMANGVCWSGSARWVIGDHL